MSQNCSGSSSFVIQVKEDGRTSTQVLQALYERRMIAPNYVEELLFLAKADAYTGSVGAEHCLTFVHSDTIVPDAVEYSIALALARGREAGLTPYPLVISLLALDQHARRLPSRVMFAHKEVTVPGAVNRDKRVSVIVGAQRSSNGRITVFLNRVKRGRMLQDAVMIAFGEPTETVLSKRPLQ